MNTPEIDKALHKERAIRGGGKCTFDAKPIDLPVGAMFEYEARAFLVTSHGYLPWSFEGYGEPRNVDSTSLVKVLTPESIVRTFVSGFTPHAHLSADR